MFPPLRPREALTLGGLTLREVAARTWEEMQEQEKRRVPFRRPSTG